MEEKEKVTFLQAIVEILVDIPPPIEDISEDKSELISLKIEIKEQHNPVIENEAQCCSLSLGRKDQETIN